MQPGEISPTNYSSSTKASCVSNNQPRRQPGMKQAVAFDDSLVYVQKQASTTAWCLSTTGLDDSFVCIQQPASTTAWCVFNNQPRRHSLFDDAAECQCALRVYVFAKGNSTNW